jgi:hypothetical protein
MEMKRRGAARVLGDRLRRVLSGPGAFRGGGELDLDIEYRKLSVYDVALLERAVRPRPVHGCALPSAAPAARARPDPRACRQGHVLVFQSMQRGSDGRGAEVAEDYPILGNEDHFDDPAYPEAALHRAALCGRSDQLVGAEPRLCGGDAANPRAFQSKSHPETRSMSAAKVRTAPVARGGLSCARHDRITGETCCMIEAAKIWNEPNNKSHWDPVLDPGWTRFCGDDGPGGTCDSRRERRALTRVLGGMSPIDPCFRQEHARGARRHGRRSTSSRSMAFPLDWNLWPHSRVARTGSPRSRRRPTKPDLGDGGRRLELRRGGSSGTGA